MVKIKKFDIVIAVLLLLLSLLPLLRILALTEERSQVRITYGGEVAYYPLSDYREVTVECSGHTLTVKISDGEVSVISSSCKDKICMQGGSITRAGSALVCLPADTVIEIVSGKEEQDAVAG